MKSVTLNCGVYKTDNDDFLDREQFIPIWGFMLSHLKLEKTELLVYAVIFTMYKNYCSYFYGSRSYLEKRTNARRSAVQNALKSLEAKELIIKKYRNIHGINKPMYIINTDKLPTGSSFKIV